MPCEGSALAEYARGILPEPLTEPYVNLSIHRAHAIARRPPPSTDYRTLPFHTGARSRFAPPTCRMPLEQSQASPKLIPKDGPPLGFERRKDSKRSGVDDDGNPLFKPIAVRTINRTTRLLLRRVSRRGRQKKLYTLHRYTKIESRFGREPKVIKTGVAGLAGR